MYYYILLLVLFATLAQSKLVYDEECIKIHNKTLDNNYLLGTWHDVLELNPSPAPAFYPCYTTNYTTVTQDEILPFKKKFANVELPFSFDTNPVRYEFSRQFSGLFFGDKEVKFYVLDPGGTTTMLSTERGFGKPYMTFVHKKIDDNFALKFRCAFSEHFVYLMSRKPFPTDEEINAAVDSLPSELRRLERYKHSCANSA